MALQSSGQISMGNINTELGVASTTSISLNQTNVRTLLGRTVNASTISMSDGYGKSNAPTGVTMTIALVAGGGGGQSVSFFGSATATGSAGGGGGQLRTTSSYAYKVGETLSVTVGAGGPGDTRGGDSSVSGASGGTLTATGGGFGQKGDGGSSYAINSSALYANPAGTTVTNGIRGGCGTGGNPSGAYAGIGGSATIAGTIYNVGGGGGGSIYNSTTSYYWAPYPGYGGGAPAMVAGGNGYNGAAASGGGGGGTGYTVGSQYSSYNMIGGSGGSGAVVIAYPDTFPVAVTTTGSPSYSASGGYRIYKFTQSGTLKW